MSSPSNNIPPGAGPVVLRRVFYIPGYDPTHPRRYREIYRKEGAAQAAISGYELTLRPRTRKGRYGWHVSSNIEGGQITCEIDVLAWSDIVRASMRQTITATYLQLLDTAWAYISSGALFRLMRLRKGPVIAALYPVGFLLVQLLLAIALGCSIFAVVQAIWGLISPQGIFSAVPGIVFGAGLGAGAAYALLRWFKARDHWFYAYYLMHDYAYFAQRRGANPPALEARMAEFMNDIKEALVSGADEVLVVGHSSGVHLAVSILADLIRAKGVPENGPSLSFLSLGQVVPMVSFLPKAHRLRADLAYLSATQALTWIDVTAPGDGGAFALCDPVAVSGVAPKDKRWPLVLSAAFSQTLSPARWRALRWKFLRLHFQYLCAFDRPGDYDYFRITAGPMTLAQRFADRAPSGSRIERVVNKFTSIAP